MLIAIHMEMCGELQSYKGGWRGKERESWGEVRMWASFASPLLNCSCMDLVCCPHLANYPLACMLNKS